MENIDKKKTINLEKWILQYKKEIYVIKEQKSIIGTFHENNRVKSIFQTNYVIAKLLLYTNFSNNFLLKDLCNVFKKNNPKTHENK